MDDEAELIKKLGELEGFARNNVHLFCNDEQKCQLSIDLLQLYLHDGHKAINALEAFRKIFDECLGTCNACVVAYYKAKEGFFQKLINTGFEDDEVSRFASRINANDHERIEKGLKSANDTLKVLPVQQRRFQAVPSQNMMAIFEALTSKSYLERDIRLRTQFEEPFQLVQTHRTLLINHYLPAMTQFLFSDVSQYVDWAERNWKRPTNGNKTVRVGECTKEDFDFAVRKQLTRAMDRLSDSLSNNWDPYIGPQKLEKFWKGLALIIDRTTPDAITHGLRAMQYSVYRFILDWLAVVNVEGLLHLLSAVRHLLVKGPKDFWDAMGAISAKAVIEGIFSAPAFSQALQQIKEPSDTQNLDTLLGWIQPLTKSISGQNTADSASTLVEWLMSRFSAPTFSAIVRAECNLAGLNVLQNALSKCCEREFIETSVGRIVSQNVIGIVEPHMSNIMSVMDMDINAAHVHEYVLICQQSVQCALQLEVQLLARARHEIHNAEALDATFKVPTLRIWPIAVSGFDVGKPALVRVLVEATSHCVGLEPLESKVSKLPFQKERKDFNNAFGVLDGCIDSSLSILQRYSQIELLKFCEDGAFIGNLSKILFLSSDNGHHNALQLVKSISGDAVRSEAIGFLVRRSFDAVLVSMTTACRKVSQGKGFYSTSRMLKIMNDLVEQLSDDQAGYLKSGILSASSANVLKHFWLHQWNTVKAVYIHTDGWSLHYRLASLQEFCRDAMDYARTLFDAFASVDSAVHLASKSLVANSTENSGEPYDKEPFSVLEAPSSSFFALSKYLRIRDIYLLGGCVDLISKILTELTRRDTKLSEQAAGYLSKIVIDEEVKSNLLPQEKATIRRLLDDNVGNERTSEYQSASATDVEDDAESAVETKFDKTTRAMPSIAKPLSSKQTVIDLDDWNAKPQDPAASSSKADLKSLIAATSSTKPPVKTVFPALHSRSTKSGLAQAQAAKEAKQADFLRKREQERLERKRRDAETAAKAKKLLPGTLARQTAGEGSALGNIGNLSREHVREAAEGMMVDSDSDEDSEENEAVNELFGIPKKSSAAVEAYNASKRIQTKQPQQPVRKIKQVRTKKDLRARVAPDLSPVHTTILGWNFFHDDDLPPGSAQTNYTFITNSFPTAQAYRKTFEPLLLLEAWQSFRQAREETNEKVYAVKVNNSMVRDNLVEISVTMELSSATERPPSEGDVLLLSKADRPSQDAAIPSCMARVFTVIRKPQVIALTLRIARSSPLRDTLLPNTTWNAEKVNSIIPLEREYGALLGLEYYDLCDEIVRAYPSPLMSYSDNILTKFMDNYNLNRAQAKALKSSIDNDGFTLIQGPPGSGKTKTIVAIVGALLSDILGAKQATAINGSRSGDIHSQSVPKKLVVCAPSNAAVDEIVMRLMQGVRTIRGEQYRPSIVRLGRSDKIDPKIQEVTLDELVSKATDSIRSSSDKKGESELQKTYMEHKATCEEVNNLFTDIDQRKKDGLPPNPDLRHKLEVAQRKKQQLGNRIDQLKDDNQKSDRTADIERNKIRQRIVDGAHILCATLSGSGHDMFRNLSLDFDTVIIDEAAQSVELSALIPLKYGCSKCIMVGDPKQLPPTVLSREAARFMYEQSMFVRIQNNNPNDVHLLDTQYRMHPEISIFPSQTFYDGKLQDGPNMAHLTARPWHADPVLGPYQFFDVQGMHQSGVIGHSLINRAEVDVAINLYRRLTSCAQGYNFNSKIGIITPYKGQLNALRNKFRDTFGDSITKIIDFNTTDAFQGRESEVIIFSCVRASNKGIGFLSDIRRMNVGITRAKSSLWVLGNSSSLMQGEYWAKMIKNAKERKKFTLDTLSAIGQPVTKVKIEHDSMKSLQSIHKIEDSKDVDMSGASGAPRPNGNTSIGDTKANGHMDETTESKKRAPSPSPMEPAKIKKIAKADDRNSVPRSIASNKRIDTDSVAPKLSGNSALSPKPIIATTVSAPRASVPGSAAAARPGAELRRPQQKKKNPAELAFIKPRRPPPR